MQLWKIEAMVYAMADKFLDSGDLEKIEEEIKMTRLGTMLYEDGKQLDKYGVKRTMKAAFATVIEHMKKRAIDSKYVIYVSHARAKEDAQKAIAMLKEAFGEVDIRMLDLGAAFVTQGGPQCVAIQYIEK